MSRFNPKIRHPKKSAFLAAYSECGTTKRAAEITGLQRWAHYQWLKTDPEYKKAFAEAKRMACQSLEAEAIRRAVDGWDEPVFYEGVQTAVKRKYSDTLLIFMLKGANPKKYAEFTTHSGNIGLEHSGKIVASHGLESLLENADYAEWLRQRASLEDCDARAICQVREPANGKPLANGKAHGGAGPGTNGHSNGSH